MDPSLGWDDPSLLPIVRAQARLRMDPRLLRRVDADDAASEVMRRVLAAGIDASLWSREQKIALLFTTLDWVIKDLNDEHLGVGKRDIRREQALAGSADPDASAGFNQIGAEQTSVTGRVVRNERLAWLSKSKAELSENQRLALELRFENGLSLPGICEATGWTEDKASGLIRRGLATLRKCKPAQDSSEARR